MRGAGGSGLGRRQSRAGGGAPPISHVYSSLEIRLLLGGVGGLVWSGVGGRPPGCLAFSLVKTISLSLALSLALIKGACNVTSSLVSSQTWF